MHKYIAEFMGTMILVFFGCGVIVVTGGYTGGLGFGFLGVLVIAAAFGLTTLAASYVLGHISGCHINPAVSLGMLLVGRLSIIDFAGYVVAQIFGAFAGSALLSLIVNSSSNLVGYGANGYDSLSAVGLSMGGAFMTETFLTFVFVITILSVTANERIQSFSGIAIGAILTMVHLIGIPLTGTSVNPARSLAPAVFNGGVALSQVWLFILAPLVGAALAALVYCVFENYEEAEREIES